MKTKDNEIVAFAGLWITLAASIGFLIQQLASVGILG
jgi:hypothetical protein